MPRWSRNLGDGLVPGNARPGGAICSCRASRLQHVAGLTALHESWVLSGCERSMVGGGEPHITQSTTVLSNVFLGLRGIPQADVEGESGTAYGTRLVDPQTLIKDQSAAEKAVASPRHCLSARVRDQARPIDTPYRMAGSHLGKPDSHTFTNKAAAMKERRTAEAERGSFRLRARRRRRRPDWPEIGFSIYDTADERLIL